MTYSVGHALLVTGRSPSVSKVKNVAFTSSVCLESDLVGRTYRSSGSSKGAKKVGKYLHAFHLTEWITVESHTGLLALRERDVAQW